MKCLELTFSDPAQNLACDEALLGWCEEEEVDEVLRLWEPQNYFVVLGYSNKIATEVDVTGCAAEDVPILRRFSGGGAVLQGPGCLNYTLVMKHEQSVTFSDVAGAYRRVLERHRTLIERLISESVQIEGISDLAIGGRKFSGNAQHRKHRYTLIHGSFLLNLDLSRVELCLHMPSRRPAYRESRSHQSFLRNLGIDAATIRRGIREEWRVDGELPNIPLQRIEELASQRYSCLEWTGKF